MGMLFSYKLVRAVEMQVSIHKFLILKNLDTYQRTDFLKVKRIMGRFFLVMEIYHEDIWKN